MLCSIYIYTMMKSDILLPGGTFSAPEGTLWSSEGEMALLSHYTTHKIPNHSFGKMHFDAGKV